MVFIAAFAALAVAFGLAFVAVPNFELVSTTFFLSGYFLGTRDGVMSAILGEFVFSLLNPLGSAAPPLMIAQIFAMVLFAFSGGLIAKSKLNRLLENEDKKQKSQVTKAIYLGIIGLLLTLVFDLLTTMSFLIFAGLTFMTFLASLVAGIHFSLMHIGMNTLIFAILIPILIPLLRNRFSLQVSR